MGLYMDIRPEIDIEVPEGLSGKELVLWFHEEYKDLLKNKEAGMPQKLPMKQKPVKPKLKAGKTQEERRREGIDNLGLNYDIPQEGDRPVPF